MDAEPLFVAKTRWEWLLKMALFVVASAVLLVLGGLLLTYVYVHAGELIDADLPIYK